MRAALRQRRRSLPRRPRTRRVSARRRGDRRHRVHGGSDRRLRTAWTTCTARGTVGAGATVALYELEPFVARTSQYQNCYGTHAVITTTNVDGGPAPARSGEAALDIEDVIGLAPQASIDVYEGPNTGREQFDTYEEIIGENTSMVISTSWGMCETSRWATLPRRPRTRCSKRRPPRGRRSSRRRATRAPTTVTMDSGRPVDDPASQPFVTGVGGTSPGDVAAQRGRVERRLRLPAAPRAVASRRSGRSRAIRRRSRCRRRDHVRRLASTTCREVPDVSGDADPSHRLRDLLDGELDWRSAGRALRRRCGPRSAALADASSACAGQADRVRQPGSLPAAARRLRGQLQRRHVGQQHLQRRHRVRRPVGL